MASQKPRLSVPLFVRILMVLALLSVTLVTMLSVLSSRTSHSIADEGVRQLASEMTGVTANNISGAVRFGKSDEIQTRLTEILNADIGVLQSIVVVDAAGNVLSSRSDNGEPVPEEVYAAANQAVQAQKSVALQKGFLMAFPVRYGPEQSVIGGVSMLWSPRLLYARLEEEHREQLYYALGVLVASLAGSALFLRVSFSRPLNRIINRTTLLADGDLETEVRDITSGSEVGKVARAIEALRTELKKNAASSEDARLVREGFMASSAAMMMADKELRITHFSPAFHDLAKENLENIKSRLPNFDLDGLIGTSADIFHVNPEATRTKLANLTFPYSTSVQMGDAVLSLKINAVHGERGEISSYVVEWQDVTETRKTTAILSALESAQLRADFDARGNLASVNRTFAETFGLAPNSNGRANLADAFRTEQGETLKEDPNSRQAVVDRFLVTIAGVERLLDGSMTPTVNVNGQVDGHVFLGRDVTEAEAKLTQAAEQAKRMSEEQRTVVDALRSALGTLSSGNLSTRIETEFAGDYEVLRQDFNTAIQSLDAAVVEIVESAATILGESGNISGAADDLSRRTEQQAATLEETAAAISELTASVASAAEGAKQANDVVGNARSSAEASGEVVQRAVDAMGKIEDSSEQISRIIGVIDDIAFQTNLLALNAGVEAARAGDAGRGFAVVASEVRGLAQRSSDAAREITNLISTSSEHVKQGVALVGRAGDALNEIVESVGGIAEHVAAIATSAREQSTGLDEINVAMNRLDQVTQKNVAMFEETTAASHTMTK